MNVEAMKYVSMISLFGSPVLLTLTAIGLKYFLLKSIDRAVSSIQPIISFLTSGIFLGTFLILILPNTLSFVGHRSPIENFGYIFIGVGFLLIAFIKESIRSYELYTLKKRSPMDEQKLISSISGVKNEEQMTTLVTLVFALGVHYFFSGILIAGQTRNHAHWSLLLIAICLHMSVVAFSVTLRLLIDAENYLRVFLAMCVWSLMGSLGVFITSTIAENSSNFDLIEAILQCLSAGTFIHVTFIDMLSDDLKSKKIYPFGNLIFIVIGFLCIVATSLWHEHPH